MDDKSTLKRMEPIQEKNKWQNKHIVKRDFWLIPFYILFNQVVPLIVLAVIFEFSFLLNNKNEVAGNDYIIIGTVISEIIILLSFYLIHKKHRLISIAIEHFKRVQKYLLIILVTYIVSLLLITGYEWMTDFLPESLQYGETQNQMLLEELFNNNWMLPLLFIDIVILTPFIEELLFRHLIIHELGKKITYGFATVLSVILFASVHVMGATSPFEIGSYIIIGASLAFVYLKSGMNLAVSITLHSLNNFISFIAIVILK
ncbi:CPBP family intramembrane glutamic endopeptidase [Staphylococcus xylosus]|uniref:CPBP family intramembrane glutamic endopeptidase n=1 Tax=Staphylococcus xylosus TaxID=1288 RepID=UPI003748FFEC